MNQPNEESTSLKPGLKNRFSCFVRISVLWILFTSINGGIHAQNVATEGLKYPWAGGLNSCTFGSIDLNLDGKPDLVIFERFGNRILPFIQEGSAGTSNYTYHPEYASLFPDLHEWVEFADYNCDGKADIFTYYAGGIRVYKNVSTTSLRFELVTDLLQSYYYTGYVGILGTPVDFPVFADLDNDGDIDILTFFGLGSFVEFHRNLSMEKYGNCDSLDFKLWDNCYGDFKESEGGNKITLDAVCPEKEDPLPQSRISPGGARHTGSTMLALDLDGNGVKDLLIGDVDFPNIISLINGGTGDSSHMISIDSTFPGSSRPVRLFSFPSCSFMDVDNDGLSDLILSPFDPMFLISDNYRSVWFYKNIGSQSAPVFQFMNDRFFQDEMIDVGTNSYPVLFDIDGDGLPDLFIGNYGYYDSSYYSLGYLHSVYTSRIAWYRNTGTAASPAFKLVTDDFAGLSSLHLTGLYPTFGDLDGDGDYDLILGTTDGSLIYLENSAGAGRPPVFKPPVFNYQSINVTNASTPQLFDLDKDGLPDLVVGKQDGAISYYKNTGNATQPRFTLVTANLGNVNVTNPNLSYYGYSTPCFFRDKHNELKLIVGSDEGKIHYFTGIENNLTGTFAESDSLFALITGTSLDIRSGSRVSPAISFLSDQGMMDLVVGNFAGGLNYYSHRASPVVIENIPETSGSMRDDFRVYPNPADQSVHFRISNQNAKPTFRQEVFNSMGTLVMSAVFTTSGDTEIKTGNLPDGIYLLAIAPLEAATIGNRHIAKFVVRH